MENTPDFPYYRMRKFMTTLCGYDLVVISKPGLPHWDEVTPAVQLLAESVHLGQDGQALLLGCGNGALGVALARQGRADRLRMVDTNWIALRMAKLTLAENGYTHVLVEPLQYRLPAEAYQTVIIDLPKGRKLARRWLVEAWGALQTSGELYLAGANSEGLQSVIQDAGSLFGNVTVLAYRKGCRIARMLKQSVPVMAPGQAVAWTAEPGITKGSWIEFTASVCGETFTLRSLPGVFSFDRVDDGTALLLEQLTPDMVQGKRVLDFGCGYGLIGMAASRLGAAWVDMLDVDLSAVAAAQENCSLNNIHNAQVCPSDVLEATGPERFDLILSNPPFHTGKQVEYGIAQTFITQAQTGLHPGGILILVANRFIRYDRLMRDLFGNVRSLTETGKFHVLESRL
jgi:16S rRNA (guanine1207-N2)-methyltransferase